MEKEIISFELAKINRGKEKLCKCDPPHYEVDIVNRIVVCTSCGATVEAFDALAELAARYETLENAQREMLSKAKKYRAMAEEEYERMIKGKVFRNMDQQYRQGMFPVCPKCTQAFDPVKIRSWINEKYLEDEQKEE